MKLLIVGTGEPIPSVGWGPIEKLIGESIKLLTSNYGQDVTLHNARQNRSLSALMAYPWRFDVIHIQEEHAVRAWLKYRRWLPAPLVVTSHYGYFAWPERWSPLFRKKVFPYILKVPNFIALSN